MSTLSRTVEELERPTVKYSIQTQDAASEQQQHNNHNRHDGGSAQYNNEIQFQDLANAEESAKASITMQVNAMSGQFLPFRPPPLPVPESETSALSEEENSALAAEVDQPQTRMYKAMFTIEETTDANGKVNIVAHSPKLIPRAFLDRMALRQVQYEEKQIQRGSWRAISVKRQRKLKMKKHKYKKLMKKQRHERLKHGRT